MQNDKILIIGKIPPPIGGVTTFVLRTIDQLKQQGHVVSLFPQNLILNIKVLFSLITRKYDAILLNTMSFPVLILLFITFNLSRTELIDHNHSRHFKNNILTKIKLFLISKAKRVSLVDRHLSNNYPDEYRSLSVISPFLPPTNDEVHNSIKHTPESLQSFSRVHDVLLVVSAWRYVFEDGVDLYGLERTVSTFFDLEHIQSSVGLVICIGDTTYNCEQIDVLKEKISRSKNIYFWGDCSSSWSLFSKNTVYLRPTSTDGNSISIHEALHFGAKVLASDVVPRPSKCAVFKYQSSEDFKIKLNSIIRDLL
ncbi:glycosyltransferase family protein [Vibrio coralliirubri]|uniref:hypothetical protein n=1 Tax=Vibrio coralliirubri TaxID=1516159 RepID=UPI0012F7DA5B|nr:hypothetical protein [Vibrio coralliirubri]